MKKKHCLSNNSRLYITKDIYSDAYFIRTDVEKFARFIRTGTEWVVWFYPFKYQRRFSTLTLTLKTIDHIFKKYWLEKYGGENALLNR